MELSLVIYLSLGIIFLGTVLFGLFFYTVSKTKYANVQKPYKIRIFEKTIDEEKFIPPQRHLRKRKFYRTNFADTIEIKQRKIPVRKKTNIRIITVPFKPIVNKRYSILNDMQFFKNNSEQLHNNNDEYNFKTIADYKDKLNKELE